jgi:hypothetical protein
MRTPTLFATLFVLGLALASSTGCQREELSGPPVPASSDPQGNDLVAGAVVVADEYGGGYRLLKIVHLDDYPLPLGHELHFIAYDPVVKTFEEGAKVWNEAKTKGPLAIAKDHVFARKIDFLKRAYRVIGQEPVTPEERKPYLESVRGH